jgi:hypothetical protein
MRPTFDTPEKNLAAGMRARDGQGKRLMPSHMSRVSACFKSELAITNTGDGDHGHLLAPPPLIPTTGR